MRGYQFRVLALLFAIACAPEPATRVQVLITGVDGVISRLELSGWLAASPLNQGMPSQVGPLARLDEVEVLLDPTARGLLRVQVRAYQGASESGCLVDDAEGSVEIGASTVSYQVTVALTRPHAGCLLRVQPTGPGRVAVKSAQGSRTCPPACEVSHPLGAPLTLEALPDADAFFADWDTVAPPGTNERLVFPAGRYGAVPARFASQHDSRDHLRWEHPRAQGNNLFGMAAVPTGRGEARLKADGPRVTCRAWAVGQGPAVLCLESSGAWAPVLDVPWRAGRLNAVHVGEDGVVWMGGSIFDDRPTVKRDVATLLRFNPAAVTTDERWTELGEQLRCKLEVGEARCGRINALGWYGGKLWLVGGTSIVALKAEVGTVTHMTIGARGPEFTTVSLPLGGPCEGSTEPVSLGTLYGLAGAPGSGVWLVGKRTRCADNAAGVVLSSPGAVDALKIDEAAQGPPFYAVSAVGSEVFVAGVGGRVLRRPPVQMNQAPTWTKLERITRNALYSIAGTSPTALWFAGAEGTLLRWDGVALAHDRNASSDLLDNLDLRALLTLGPDELWAGGEYGLLQRRHGTSWRKWPEPRAALPPLLRIGGHRADDIWAVGKAGALWHWDGGRWREDPFSLQVTEDLSGIWVSQGGEVWVAGGGFRSALLLHRDTVGAWRTIRFDDVGGPLRAVYGFGSVLWLVGVNTIRRCAIGMALSCTAPAAPFEGELTSLWGSAADDLWAVGKGGLIVHLTDDKGAPAWTKVIAYFPDPDPRGNPVPIAAQWLTGVWGSSKDDVWIVGDGGIILHREKDVWNSTYLITSPPRPPFTALFGTSDKDLWASGSNGVLYHWDGKWSQVISASFASLGGIWGSPGGTTWFVGDAGWTLNEAGGGLRDARGGVILSLPALMPMQ